MDRKWHMTRPLTDQELQLEAEKGLEGLLPEDSEGESHKSDSGSETEDHIEEVFSPSESEFEPSTTTDSEWDYNAPSTSKKRKTTQKRRRSKTSLGTKQHTYLADKENTQKKNNDSDESDANPENERAKFNNKKKKPKKKERSSEQEQSVSDEEGAVISVQRRLPSGLKGKNGHRWCSLPKARSKIPQRDIVHFVQGPSGDVREAETPLEIFH